MDDLKERLRAAQRQRGSSSREMSAEIGVSFSSLCRFLRGEGDMSPANTRKVRRWLGDDVPEPVTDKDRIRSLEARLAKAEAERDVALRECSKWAREAGLAEGRLAGSEQAGIVEGWKERVLKAEAERDAIEAETLPPHMVELVVTARELVCSEHRPCGAPDTQAEIELIELFDNLDQAVERFAEIVPWHDDPTAIRNLKNKDTGHDRA